MKSCPYANDPNACFAEKRRRYYRALPFERIECDYCPHAYDNGLKADRPVDDSRPFKGVGNGPIICPECGKRLHKAPVGGICADCRKLLYGNMWRKACPICGQPMSLTSPMCRACWKKSIPPSTKTVCPICGGRKHKQAAMCGACRKAADEQRRAS